VEGSDALGPVAAAITAGGIASLVLAPAEATRIRQVTDPAYAGDSMLDAAARLAADEGTAGLLRGVPATFSKQVPYTATKQVAFDALLDGLGGLGPRWATTAASAFAAALLSTLASQPGDAILSEVSRGRATGGGGGGDADDRSVGAVARRLGPAGLARGLRARLVQVGLIVTVQLIVYDSLKHAFGVP
jgi:hypothetical protein